MESGNKHVQLSVNEDISYLPECDNDKKGILSPDPEKCKDNEIVNDIEEKT